MYICISLSLLRVPMGISLKGSLGGHFKGTTHARTKTQDFILKLPDTYLVTWSASIIIHIMEQLLKHMPTKNSHGCEV